ncbi:hypothetical protein LSAT2_022372 [Lamellibrachia satsuma]|nr:hypothetical protein LSAT2_022372 [Lamellibrachia satsuma]
MTKADDPRLVELFGRHGKKWTLIAQEMGTTVRVVQRRWTSMQKPVTKGYWSMKEDNLLTEVVKEFVGDHYLDLDKSVSSWSEIAERMPGRDKDQCYAHWFGVIQPRLKCKVAGIKQPVLMGSRRVICDFTNRQLIECIDSLHVDCATKIDWTKVQQLVDKNLPLAIFRSRWTRMKSRVPGYKRKTFTEIMEYLLQARSAKRSRYITAEIDSDFDTRH